MGVGNIYPKALAKLFDLASKGQIAEALELQDLASATDAAFVKVGIAGTKWFLQKHNGYPNARMRRPLLELDPEAGAVLEKDPDVIRFLEIENSL
jgi:dihydrodipicolinate synthase/N-acetylneuraminate lyase